MKTITILITILTAISPLFVPLTTTAQGLNPSFHTIFLNNFNEKIYTEDRSRYILSSSDSNFSLPNTPFQNVLKKSKKNQKYYITIKSGSLKQKKYDISTTYLQNTRFLNIHNKEIILLKSRFAGSKDTINEVEHFVFNYIDKKKFGIPIISAKNILRNRSGDCTEHSILTISILRSLKIPSRAAVGMILCRDFEGHKNIFVFHMWVETYMNCRWILVDSTRPGKRHPNRYITFSYHHLKTEMPLSYLKSISAIKNLTVEYIDK